MVNNILMRLAIGTMTSFVIIGSNVSPLFIPSVLADEQTATKKENVDNHELDVNESPLIDSSSGAELEEGENQLEAGKESEKQQDSSLVDSSQDVIDNAEREDSSIQKGRTNQNSYDAGAIRAEVENMRVSSPFLVRATSPQDAFINKISAFAVEHSKKYGIFASVILAQAIVESGWGGSSLSLPPHNNLFGIKGSYNGQSSIFWTQEWVNGQYIWIQAAFRKYPSYKESLEDNAKLLRYGIDGAPNFYKGTWIENAASYKESTAWLQNRYATSPTYEQTLNNIIETYNLTRFDGLGVANISDVNYGARISPSAEKYGINNEKKMLTKLSGSVENVVAPYNYRVTLSQKVITGSGRIFYLIRVNGVGFCWIEDKYLTISESVSSIKDISASGLLIKNESRYGVTSDSYIDSLSSNWSSYSGKKVRISKKLITTNGKEYYLLHDYTTGVGIAWIPTSSVELSKKIVSKSPVNNIALILANTNRYGLYGNNLDSLTSTWADFVGKQVRVTEKAVADDGEEYYLVRNYTTNVGIAWIPDFNITIGKKIISSNTVNITGTIVANSSRYGVYGDDLSILLSDWKMYVGKKVKITSKAVTNEGEEYYLVKDYVTSVGIAWIPASKVGISQKIEKTVNLNTTGTILANDNRYGLYGNDLEALTTTWESYVGQKVNITGKATTTTGDVYYLVKDYKTNVGIAWISASKIGVSKKIASRSSVSLEGEIISNINRYGIYGENIEVLSSTWGNYLEEKIKITEKATTTDGEIYYLIRDFNTNVGIAWTQELNVKIEK